MEATDDEDFSEFMRQLEYRNEDICKCPFCDHEEQLGEALDEGYDPFSGDDHVAYCPSCEEEYFVQLSTRIMCQTRKPTEEAI